MCDRTSLDSVTDDSPKLKEQAPFSCQNPKGGESKGFDNHNRKTGLLVLTFRLFFDSKKHLKHLRSRVRSAETRFPPKLFLPV